MTFRMKLIDKNGHLNEEAIALFAEGLIDSTTYGEIPPEVMDHVDSCFECKQKVMDVFEIIRNDEETKEQSRLKNTLPEKKQSKVTKVARISPAWMLAAAAVVLLIGFYFIFKSFQPATNEQLFAEYFTPYQNLLTMKGDNEVLLESALKYYDAKMWDSAVICFEKIREPNQNIQTIRFYEANALLSLGKTPKAERLLLQVIASNDDLFKTLANWYLALALIKSGKKDEATEILKTLKSETGIYGEKAMDLLNRLE